MVMETGVSAVCIVAADMYVICCLQMCLGIQRLITNKVVDQKGAGYITDTFWMVVEAGMEGIKIVQSVVLLLTFMLYVARRCALVSFRG